MKLFNTLSKQKEELKPLRDKKIGMYTCGPTVYDVAHIGNLRKYICDDLLYRTLVANDYQVTRVMNITDVDDKTIKRAEGNRKKFEEQTKGFEVSFFEDLKKLNIVEPTEITRATEYIDQMVEFIEDLIKKGYAYKTSDGSVYFSITKFKSYGKLSGLENRELKVGARVNSDEYDKENPSDFALWKTWDESDGEIFWETSLGKGRPGWHIECSAMAMDTLGTTIDIHTGGVDNIFPHHENEIAQSEARSDKKFVNYWVHNEHLLVDGRKMSKSLGNFFRLSDIEKKGYNPLDFRYLVSGAHYRSKLNFTWEGLEAAKNARERLSRLLAAEATGDLGIVNQTYLDQFNEKVSDDINIPEGLAVLWELVRDNTVTQQDKKATILAMDKILGLNLVSSANRKQFSAEGKAMIIVGFESNPEIEGLVADREKAKKEKNFNQADTLREKIEKMGYKIEDTNIGPRLSKK